MAWGRSLVLHRIAIVVLLAVIAGLAYKFIVAGSTVAAPDGRLAILVSNAERDLVLREMRGFVSGLQEISAALAREDMKAVASAARRMGTGASHEAPAPLLAKLPLSFKTLAFGVHRGFDTLAMDAEALGMPRHSLEQLAAILQDCAACHARYAVAVSH